MSYSPKNSKNGDNHAAHRGDAQPKL